MSYSGPLTPKARRINKMKLKVEKVQTSPRRSRRICPEFFKISPKIYFTNRPHLRDIQKDPSVHSNTSCQSPLQYFQSYNPYVLGSINSIAYCICSLIQTTVVFTTCYRSKKILQSSINWLDADVLVQNVLRNTVNVFRRETLAVHCVSAPSARTWVTIQNVLKPRK